MTDQQAQSDKQVLLQQLYVKEYSFESPKAPEVFLSNFNTEILLNVRSDSREIDADTVEVTLTLKVKSVMQDGQQEETAFQIELAQAGTFAIQGFTPEERFAVLGTVCPATLYPFARVAIADAASKGGFPELLLQPLDFQTLYAQNMQARAAASAAQARATEGSGEAG